MGGLGLLACLSCGASMKKIKRDEPILVDFGICYHGYQVDKTRMYAIGSMPEPLSQPTRYVGRSTIRS
jgi:Xaa-Pro aminopeptidase